MLLFNTEPRMKTSDIALTEICMLSTKACYQNVEHVAVKQHLDVYGTLLLGLRCFTLSYM